MNILIIVISIVYLFLFISVSEDLFYFVGKDDWDKLFVRLLFSGISLWYCFLYPIITSIKNMIGE